MLVIIIGKYLNMKRGLINIIFLILLFSCDPGKYIYVNNNTKTDFLTKIYFEQNNLYNNYLELINDSLKYSDTVICKIKDWRTIDLLEKKQKLIPINDTSFKLILYGKSTTLIGPLSYFPVKEIDFFKQDKKIFSIDYNNKRLWKKYKREGIIKHRTLDLINQTTIINIDSLVLETPSK
jgi:predicted phosphohydrolase